MLGLFFAVMGHWSLVGWLDRLMNSIPSVYDHDNEHWMTLEDRKDSGKGGLTKHLACLVCCLSAGLLFDCRDGGTGSHVDLPRVGS
jgi:hypothetical protein